MGSRLRQYDLSNLRVLVVDPNWHMLSLLRSVLRALGVQRIDLADRVDLALETCPRAMPDIIITEFATQLCDGIGLIKAVRAERAGIAPYTPIIVLSAYTEESNIQLARDAGMNEFLAKPISARGLYQRIQRVVEDSRPFVVAKVYRGPDRRRHDDGPVPPYRRVKDKKGSALSA